MRVDELSSHPRNSREHSPEQVKQIADSIKAFGFNDVIEVDEAGVILSGHGRLEAARLLGLETVPCRVLAHMTATEKRAYMLAANRIADNSEVNKLITALELYDLKEEGIEPGMLGFSDKRELAELAALIDGDVEVEEQGEPMETGRVTLSIKGPASRGLELRNVLEMAVAAADIPDVEIVGP